jgi:hypothetical protein
MLHGNLAKSAGIHRTRDAPEKDKQVIALTGFFVLGSGLRVAAVRKLR